MTYNEFVSLCGYVGMFEAPSIECYTKHVEPAYMKKNCTKEEFCLAFLECDYIYFAQMVAKDTTGVYAAQLHYTERNIQRLKAMINRQCRNMGRPVRYIA